MGEKKGDVIGRYTLVRELGEGGMGTVWLARQSEPVVRNVALKIIKAGMDTREVIARFEAERQALALMDHPWIAKVLDGGATQAGRPFFVMEHVKGVPINEHCESAKLDTRARLELFMQVCEAIQHAHQKGIIHRDIKPSNVLVSESGGERAPKVIDFGIAKATTGEFAQGTLLTQHAQVLGTPEYMAPEQAATGGLDIDTRADVYSLGMLLYELLTSCKPFDLQSVFASGYDEVLRTIREVDPPLPSTRVSQSETKPQIAAGQRVDLDTLVKRLSGDLDWVVMKALEKDRSRRYASASELANDIARYLASEPVMAAPPSTLYRLRKLVQRRRKTVIAVAAALLLFVAGSIGTGVGLWKTMQANAALDRSLVEEQRQRGLAEENEKLATDAKTLADAEALRATRAEADTRERALELEQVAEFQSEQLRRVDPERMGAGLREALLAQVAEAKRSEFAAYLAGIDFTGLALGSLDENLFGDTLETIETRFEAQPLVRARLLQTMARTLRQLGLIESALEPQEHALAALRQLLGDEHPETLKAIGSAAVLHGQLGDFEKAAGLFREELASARRVLGDEHAETIGALGSLGATLWSLGRREEVEPLYREAFETSRRVLGEDHPDTLAAQSNMAGLLRDRAQYEEAAVLYEDCIQRLRRVFGDDNPDTLDTLRAASSLYRRSGDYVRSEELAREALRTLRRTRGNEHPRTLGAMDNLSAVLGSQDKYEESEALDREGLEAKRRTLGDDHPETLVSLSNLGVSLLSQGRRLEAEPLLREAETRRRQILGDEHPTTLTSISNLGAMLQIQGLASEAEPYLHEAAAGRMRALGRAHPSSALTSNRLRSVLETLIEAARAEPDEPRLGEWLTHSGAFELESGAPEAALPLLAEAEEILSVLRPESDAGLWRLRCQLGLTLAELGQREEAQFLLAESAERILESAAGSAPFKGLHERPAPASERELVLRVIEVFAGWEQAHPGQEHAQEAARLRALLGALER